MSMPTRSKPPRAQQRDATRERIVAAAVTAFAEKGFRGASTRDIARRARTNQGLITYHFRSKDALWRAAVDRIFGMLEKRLGERLAAPQLADPRERVRAGIREYVRFVAAQPEMFRMMVDAGNGSDARMRWLVDTHVKPRFEVMMSLGMAPILGIEEFLVPHAFYALAGAASVIFAVAPECRRLTGLDPRTEQAVETHAEFVARLMVP
jgi:TetR/AcrR family transcriptional regulator